METNKYFNRKTTLTVLFIKAVNETSVTLLIP